MSDDGPRHGSRFQLELANTKDLHIADFVTWNNKDMDMQRHYHAADVVVEWGGVRTEGVEPQSEPRRHRGVAPYRGRTVGHSGRR